MSVKPEEAQSGASSATSPGRSTTTYRSRISPLTVHRSIVVGHSWTSSFLQGRGSRPPPSEEKSTTFLVALDAGSSQGRTSRPSCISPVTEGDSETEGRYCPIGHCCNREETMKNQHLARLIGVAALGVSGLGGAGMLIPSLGATGIAGALPTCTAAGGTGLTASVIATTNQAITGATDATGCDLGIYVGPGVTSVTISHATVTGANDHGIFAQDTSGLQVTNSTVSGNGVAPTAGIAENKAIELVGVSNSTVSGNTVSGNLADGGIGVADDGQVA